jgi:glucose/arabinose dehydrogenase
VDGDFAITDHGEFDEPWALAFAPGTDVLFITEQPGTMKFVDTASGRQGTVTGLPSVDYGGQGGFGDVAFLPAEESAELSRRTIYLTWAEAGSGGTRGAVLGKGALVCEETDACRIDGLEVIWRQVPKVTGRGHYSHRIAFSPDGRYLFLASGDRQKMQPAQDLSNTLGSVLRLTLDGQPAPGNPFADRGSPSDEIWSYGHRNILGLAFDAEGQLWDLEHGPRGGDELNRVERGANYGWPVVSNGVHYSGDPIPDHDTRPEFAAPAVSWTPVIAPGDMLFYSGAAFPAWQGDALIAGLVSRGIVRVTFDGGGAREAARYDLGERLRGIAEDRTGALWVIEDGKRGRLRKLSPQS